MDGSPAGSFAHGILQARILERVAFPPPENLSSSGIKTHISCVSCIGRQILYHWATNITQSILNWAPCIVFPGCPNWELALEIHMLLAPSGTEALERARLLSIYWVSTGRLYSELLLFSWGDRGQVTFRSWSSESGDSVPQMTVFSSPLPTVLVQTSDGCTKNLHTREETHPRNCL